MSPRARYRRKRGGGRRAPRAPGDQRTAPDRVRTSRTDSDLYWKITTTAFDRAYKWTDGRFRFCGHERSAQEQLVEMLDGIDADVQRYLEFDDPHEQARILYERFYEIQREWAGTG